MPVFKPAASAVRFGACAWTAVDSSCGDSDESDIVASGAIGSILLVYIATGRERYFEQSAWAK